MNSKKDYIALLIRWVLASIMLIMIVSVLLEVISRYIFNSPLEWTEEIGRLTYIWITFLGAVILAKNKAYLEVSFFNEKMPPVVRYWFKIVINILIIVFLSAALANSTELLKVASSIRLEALGISSVCYYLAFIVSAIGIIGYTLLNTIKMIFGMEKV